MRIGGRGLAARVAPAIVLALCAAGAALANSDPFYTGLLRDGRTALLRGDAAGARKDLRVACFGLLDTPMLLAECRVRLALAEAALGDREAFLESFSRLEEIEERFTVYATAAISAEERAAFEERVVEWVSPEQLRSIPAFTRLVERKAEAELARLSPRDRFVELERLAAAAPAEPRWKVRLAEEELARKRPAPALARLDKLGDETQGGAVGCLRGRALAELDRCAEAARPLAACVRSPADPILAGLVLGCLLELERADEASAFAARLAPAVAAQPEIRKRIERIPKPAERAAATPPGTGAAAKPANEPSAPAQPKAEKKPVRPPATTAAKPPGATVPATTKPAPATASPGSPPAATPAKRTQEETEAVAEARRIMKSAERRADLERALGIVRPIADRYRDEVELQLLAGELGYRLADWTVGVEHLRRVGPQGPSDPTIRFYYVVCLFETGEKKAAAEVAATGLERLPRSPFVDGYLKKIQSGAR
jgi:hypothetical protein